MTIVVEEESLFQSWRETRPGFVEDGVVSEQDYLTSSPSIVVILKEVNDPDGGGWDLRQFLRNNGGRPQTWNNVARWVHGIRNRGQGDDWPNQYEKISKGFRVEVLRSICVINLNKSPGTHTTKIAKLKKVATEDAVLIQSQYAIYDPDLTICGGTGDLFREVVDHGKHQWSQTRRGTWWYQRAPEKVVIAYSHPAARVQSSLLHYGLIDAVNELLA